MSFQSLKTDGATTLQEDIAFNKESVLPIVVRLVLVLSQVRFYDSCVKHLTIDHPINYHFIIKNSNKKNVKKN